MASAPASFGSKKEKGEQRAGEEECAPYMNSAFLYQAGLMDHPLNTQEITSG